MLPNIFWSRTDYISGAYVTKMVAILSPGYIYISCLRIIWADLAFPVSMSGNWAEW